MKKKSEFTILERAMQTIDGFDKVYHKMQQQTILGGWIIRTKLTPWLPVRN